MNFLQRVIRADTTRKTRFHDEKGNLVGWRAAMHAPSAFAGAALRVAFGYRPVRPWISYTAAAEIGRHLNSSSRVVEFGSGMSTAWLARRCGFLLSIESNPVWFNHVQGLLVAPSCELRYELRTDLARYPNLDDIRDASLDFVLVDGAVRSQCVAAALPKVKPGGWLYLDNVDKDQQGGDLRVAEGALLAAIKQRSGRTRYFTDFVPCQATAVQGLLAIL